MQLNRLINFKSIQLNIAFWSGLCVLAMGVAMIVYAVVTQRSAALQAAQENALATAQTEAGQIGTQIESALDAARTLAQAFSAIKIENMSLSRDQADAMLRQVVTQNPKFLAAYTLWEPDAFDGLDSQYANAEGTDETGRYIPYWVRSNGQIIVEPLVDYETAGPGDYYQIPKNTRQEAIIDPYLYPINGVDVLITSLVVPIMANGQFYGIAGVDLPLDFLQELADEFIAYGGAAKVAIISNNGSLAAVEGQPDLVGQTMKEFKNGDTGWENDLAVIQSGQTKVNDERGIYETYVPVTFGSTATPWSVNLIIPTSTITAEATASMWRMLAIGALLNGLAIALLWFAAGNIASPVKRLTRIAGVIAQGDLDQEVDVLQADEVGLLANAFREMIAYLREMVATAQAIAQGDLSQDVQPRSAQDGLGSAFSKMIASLRQSVGQMAESANSLSEASSQLAQAAGQAGQATNQIASTVQQVAKGTAQQSEAVNRTAASIEQMSHAIDGVARGAQEQSQAVSQASNVTGEISSAIQQVAGNAAAVSEQSTQAASAARTGVQSVQHTVQGMEAIRAKVGLSAQKVQEMGQRSGQVGAIVETIEDIASQTNLLALNAAIEAARAGEHGKGFAVVADEVRKLAERASAATKEIGGLIRSIQSTVSEAVAAMNESAREVENGVVLANQAGSSLGEIVSASEAVLVQAEQATASANRMTQASDQLVGAVDSVSAVVEENTAATEQMAASSSEVTQSIENIASVSEENSAAIEEVSASAEEMSAQVEEVTASAQSLAELASALQSLVAQFKLEAGQGAPYRSGSSQPGQTSSTQPKLNGHRKEILAGLPGGNAGWPKQHN